MRQKISKNRICREISPRFHNNSRLDYCNSLLYGLPYCALTKLQRVQNATARVLYLAPRYCHITPILYKLHWLPVTFRIEYKIIINTHKAIPCTSPDYSSSLVNFKPNSSYSLRSNNKYLLSNPNFRTLPTLGDRAFVGAAPKLWNNLPLDLRCTSDFKAFKRNLKTHPFKKAFFRDTKQVVGNLMRLRNITSRVPS